MELTINGNIYNIKPYACSPADTFPFYINITNACNARCKFCSNEANKNYGDLDLVELKNILDQVHDKISRFSISGGETLLYPEKLEKLLDLLDNYNIRITLNTNGVFLKDNVDLLNKYNNIESIQLSRHHYLDDKNNSVFQVKTIPFNEVIEIKEKLNGDLRINCLLIKDYIDSKEEVVKFLEETSKSEISQVGFISMMKVNDFTKDNFVNYKDIVKEFNDDFSLTKKMCDGDRCSCDNYIYVAENGKPIFVYFRYTKKYTDGGRSLFYDCKGLKEGY